MIDFKKYRYRQLNVEPITVTCPLCGYEIKVDNNTEIWNNLIPCGSCRAANAYIDDEQLKLLETRILQAEEEYENTKGIFTPNKQQKRDILIDMAARIPYGLIVTKVDNKNRPVGEPYVLHSIDDTFDTTYIRPYLKDIQELPLETAMDFHKRIRDGENNFDIYNQYHLDHNNLITRGLALKATEGMYKNE